MPSEGVANSQVLSRSTIVAAGSSRYWRRVLARLSRDKVTLAAFVVLAAIVLMALFAPWLTNGDPYSGSALQRLKPIGTSGHPLGTDEIGRDLWARLAYGGRLSMLVGILPVAFALAIGGSLGVLAGYVGGWLNTLIMRTMDVFYAFPSVLLAVAIAAVAGSGLINTVLALGIVFIPPMVRIAESVSTRVRNMDFIDAARASGVSTLKIIQHHVLRNVLGPVLVYAASLTSLSIVCRRRAEFPRAWRAPATARMGPDAQRASPIDLCAALAGGAPRHHDLCDVPLL